MSEQKAKFGFYPLAVVWCTLILPLSSCGTSISTTKDFIVYMKTIAIAPTGAEGNATPDGLTVKLQGIQLIKGETSEIVNVYEDQEEKDFTIIDRDQVIYSQPVTGVENNTFASATIQLAAEAQLKSKYAAAQVLDLATVPIVTTEAFTCGKGRECRLHIYVEWKNILLRDTAAKTDTLQANPSFRVVAND